MRIHHRIALMLVLAASPAARLAAGGLDGSPASMENQHEVAVEADYSFLRKPADVEHLVDLGKLVKVEGNDDYTLSKVSFPVARPEVLSFIEHLAAEYHDLRRGKMVVTSLTRPLALQPTNAHDLSVHPAGMAVDLRVPADSTMRVWLERRLLELEKEGAIDVTREHRPPHYHVAVFGEKYLPIAARLDSARAVEKARADSIARVEKQRADSLEAERARSTPSGAPILLGSVAALAVCVPVIRRRRRRSSI